MLDLKMLVTDVENLIKLHDPDVHTLIMLAISIFLDQYTNEEIAKAFNDANFEANVSNEHLFLSIDGDQLRIPLRPLAIGDYHDPSQPDKICTDTKKVSPRNPRPRRPHP